MVVPKPLHREMPTVFHARNTGGGVVSQDEGTHTHLVEGCELHRKGLLVHCQLSSVKNGEIVVPQAHLGGARPQRWVTKDVLPPRAQGRHFSPGA